MIRDPVSRLRALCLALPGAEERTTWDRSTFRVGERIFAMAVVRDAGPAVVLKAPPHGQTILVEAAPERFFVPAYVGHKGWVGLRLGAGTDWDEVAGLVERSHRLVAPRRLSRPSP